MAVYDLRKQTNASSGQRIVQDEASCDCSQKIQNLESKIEQLQTLILQGTLNNGRDKDISNINQ